MFDKELFYKIQGVTCTFEELKTFVSKIDEKEFDLDNAFEKYYSLACILHAIDEYKTQRIDDTFLSHWATAYNWIIMSGFKLARQKTKGGLSVKQIVVDEISEWLDALSFFETDNEEYFEWECFTAVFSTLDRIYKNANEWSLKRPQASECGDGNGGWILLVNAQQKTYVEICREGYYVCDAEQKLLWDKASLDGAVQALNANGYIEMPYGNRAE